MTYTVIIAVAITMYIILLITKPNFFTALITSASWGVFWWFWINNPLTTIPQDSPAGTIIMLVLGVMVFSPFIITFMRFNGNNKSMREQRITEMRKENPNDYYNSRGNKKSLNELSPSEYREVVRSKLRSKR